MPNVEESVYLAKLAEQAERYEGELPKISQLEIPC
jgi:hypothetical protein